MSQTCLHELLQFLRYDYRQTPGKGAKGGIIDHWCRASGHERKYAIKELRAQRGPVLPGAAPPPAKAKRSGGAVKYGPEIISLLKAMWLQHEQPYLMSLPSGTAGYRSGLFRSVGRTLDAAHDRERAAEDYAVITWQGAFF